MIIKFLLYVFGFIYFYTRDEHGRGNLMISIFWPIVFPLAGLSETLCFMREKQKKDKKNEQ